MRTPVFIAYLWCSGVLAIVGCGDADADPPVTPQSAAKPNHSEQYEALLETIGARRAALSKRYFEATSAAARDAVRAEARSFLLAVIRDELMPAWYGTPWGLGKNSTSTRPHLPEMTVGCSYFVTSVLENSGLTLSNRYTFAQAPALHIQRSLAPDKAQLHRFLSISAKELDREVRALGDGLYLSGSITISGSWW